MLPFELTKDTPYLALSGELWSVFYEYFTEIDRVVKGFYCIQMHCNKLNVVSGLDCKQIQNSVWVWGWEWWWMCRWGGGCVSILQNMPSHKVSQSLGGNSLARTRPWWGFRSRRKQTIFLHNVFILRPLTPRSLTISRQNLHICNFVAYTISNLD